MKNAVQRLTVGTVAALVLAVPAAAQRPGSNSTNLPPHVAEHLWPERQLSPVEQEFKDRVIAMRDSLTRVNATVALLERQHRSGASSGMIRSSARSLAADCDRSGRAAESMAAFAADFQTNDAKWGEPTVRAFRAAVAELAAGMRRCNEVLTTQAATATPDAERVLQAASAAGGTVASYQRAEQDLLRTLKIRVDPKLSGTPAGR